MWLAFWRQNITNTPKYVLFSANSSLRGRSDMKKFSVAQRLKGCVKDIRKQYMADLESEDTTVMQRATAMWVIDHLALRVGNDKGKDEADTVGCCSLRVEHVKLHVRDFFFCFFFCAGGVGFFLLR
jgi:DNA topoisomerase-1